MRPDEEQRGLRQVAVLKVQAKELRINRAAKLAGEGLSVNEIAEAMGMSQTGVRSLLLARGLSALRREGGLPLGLP